MDEQHDAQQDSYVSVTVVLPDNERRFFSINPEITVADFTDILKNNAFISDLNENKFSIMYSGKILQDKEKFSTFPNSDHIILYILLYKPSNAETHAENSIVNDLIHNTENMPDDLNLNEELQIAEFQELDNFRNLPLLQRIFRYNFFPFNHRRQMDDEDPILEDNENNNEDRVNPCLIKVLDLAIVFIYFVIGFALGFRAFIIYIFFCLFSSPKISSISSIFEGMIVRFSWDCISPLIF